MLGFLVGLALLTRLNRRFLIPLGAHLEWRGRSLYKTLPIPDPTNDDFTLYLRSFADDSLMSRIWLNSSRGMFLSLFMDFGGMAAPPDRSIEEWLAIIAKELFGTMIAAQQPGQRISIPGAARLTFSDQNWRESVTDLITRARLIIIAAGDSDNLTWEIEQVLKLAQPDRVIILVNGERPIDRVPRSLSRLPHQHRIATLLGHLPAMARTAHLRWRAQLANMPFPERVMFRLGSLPLARFPFVLGVLYFRDGWAPMAATSSRAPASDPTTLAAPLVSLGLERAVANALHLDSLLAEAEQLRAPAQRTEQTIKLLEHVAARFRMRGAIDKTNVWSPELPTVVGSFLIFVVLLVALSHC